jgi:hypothetical protein
VAAVPLYEDLVRRAIDALEEARLLERESQRIRDLAQILRNARDGKVSIRRCALEHPRPEQRRPRRS